MAKTNWLTTRLEANPPLTRGGSDKVHNELVGDLI